MATVKKVAPPPPAPPPIEFEVGLTGKEAEILQGILGNIFLYPEMRTLGVDDLYEKLYAARNHASSTYTFDGLRARPEHLTKRNF